MKRVYLPVVTSKYPNYKGVGVIGQYPYTCEDLDLLGIGHYHDWGPWPKDCPGIESVCMWWGLSSMDKPTNPNCKTVLLWNEPQIPGQSDIEPLVGAEKWPEVEAKAAGLDYSTPCADLPWLTEWADVFYRINGRWPGFGPVCIHSYPHLIPPRTVEDARGWSLTHGGDGRVWLHEFALWPAWKDIETTEIYIEGIRPWLVEQGIPHNWFALRNVGDYFSPYYDTSLVIDGELTQLGIAYTDH